MGFGGGGLGTGVSVMSGTVMYMTERGLSVTLVFCLAMEFCAHRRPWGRINGLEEAMSWVTCLGGLFGLHIRVITWMLW